jgi:hypothetical protein
MAAGHLLEPGAKRFLNAVTVGVLFLGLVVLAPAGASAANMWFQQAILLIHVPLGGGLFFTTNYVFTANQGPAMVNVKCFNDTSQRVGQAQGVNIELNATGQVRHVIPAELGVLGDQLFRGFGWCWANNTVGGADYNVQITVGATSNLGPSGILNSPSSTAVGTNTGLAETSTNLGGIPFFTTIGGVENYVFIVNPTLDSLLVNLQLFDAGGFPQGSVLIRTLFPRDLELLQIPQVFNLPTPPTSGSVGIILNQPLPENGYTGWFLQPHPTGNRMVFTAIGLDGNNQAFLLPAFAPP